MVLTSDELDQVADLLDDAVRRLRMLPFAEACQGLDRLVPQPGPGERQRGRTLG